MNARQTPPKEILKGLLVWRNAQGLRIIYTWRDGHGGTIPLIGEGFFLLIGLVFFIYMTFGMFQPKNMTASQWGITIPFILISLFISYRGLGIFINKSVIEIAPDGFESSNRPIPFLGAKALKLLPSEISKIEWEQVGQSSMGSQLSGHRSGYTSTYSVVVITRQGKNEKIITNINNREYAFAIQSELSRFLKLKG
jgi:hypothetical protein